jgi:iron(III) transport system permease protein
MSVTDLRQSGLAPTLRPNKFRFPKTQHPPLFLVVPGIVVSMLAILPLAYLVLRASSAGGEKVVDILLRPRTHQIFLNSVGLAFTVVIATVAIGVALAWLTVRTDLPGKRAWSVLTVLPLVIPSYVGAFTMVSALGPKGLVQGMLEPLGVDRLPSIYGFTGAALTLTLFTYPYVLLSVRAALHGLDPSLEEAARTLGRHPLAVFREITLPHLKPSIIAGGLLVALYTLSDFGAVSMMRFDSFTRAIYMQYSASFDRSVAAVLALLLVGLTLIILIIEHNMRGKAKYYRSSSGTIRPASVTRLGWWRWPALAFCGAITVLALFLPVVVIIYWLARGFQSGEAINFQLEAVFNSVVASGSAAVLAILAAIPVIILTVRFPGRVSRWLERSTYIGYALPGVVLALSLVFFSANYATFLYQTMVLLVVAYIVRFLPQAIGSGRTSLLQVSPRLEDAARNLGRTPLQAVTSITIPLVRPGLLTGLSLVFLTAMKELPATLLLGPTGFRTMATRIWDYTAEAFFAQAAVPALLLVVVSAIAVWLLLSQEEKKIRS